MKYTVSVVIPFYNGELYFDECINSVLNQTFTPQEIIVVNDSPSTSSIKFLDKYISNVIHIIHLENNRGPAHARNVGIFESCSELIAFIDCDDKWHKTKLETQLKYFNENPEISAVHTGVQVFSNNLAIKNYVDKPKILEIKKLLKENQTLTSSIMIRKKDLEEVSLYNESLQCSEDYDLTIRLVLAGKKIHFLPNVLTFLRRENHNNITSNWKAVFKGHISLLWRYKHIYIKELGFIGFIEQISFRLQQTGYSCGGNLGKLIIIFSKILTPNTILKNSFR